jgi:hypothetical protein
MMLGKLYNIIADQVIVNYFDLALNCKTDRFILSYAAAEAFIPQAFSAF